MLRRILVRGRLARKALFSLRVQLTLNYHLLGALGPVDLLAHLAGVVIERLLVQELSHHEVVLHRFLVLLHLHAPVLLNHLRLLRVFGHEGDGGLVVEAGRQQVVGRLTEHAFAAIARLASVVAGGSLLLQDDLFDPLRGVLHLHLFLSGLRKRIACLVYVDRRLDPFLMFCGCYLAELGVEYLCVRRVVHVPHQLLRLKKLKASYKDLPNAAS